MPVLLAWLKPGNITWSDLLDGATPSLHASETRRHDERLSERVCVSRRTGTSFKRHRRAGHSCGSRRLKQRIDANRSGEVVA
jgi:hypothetical protein